MTFLDRCIICGGPVLITPGNGWGPDEAKCVGFCGSKQERIEDASPEQLRRMIKAANRRRAIEEAKDIELKGDRL